MTLFDETLVAVSRDPRARTLIEAAPVSRAVETMRTAVLVAPRRVAVREAALPIPDDGQVRVRVESCGVCGSNIPVWQGREWFRYPLDPGAPGHEGVGVIEAVGPGVDPARVGQRVATLAQGSFATHEIVDARRAVALPQGLEGHFPGEAIGCAMNVFRRSGVAPGQRVAVVGVGFLGALLVQMSSRAGAAVVALSRRACALDAARRMGADDTVSLDGSTDRESLLREAFDVVIECTGHQGPLDVASRMVRERGRLVIAGFHQDGPRTVDMQSWNWRGIDVINAHEREDGAYLSAIDEGARAVAEGRLDPSALYTHVYPLERLDEALRAAEERPKGFMKSIVTMGGGR